MRRKAAERKWTAPGRTEAAGRTAGTGPAGPAGVRRLAVPAARRLAPRARPAGAARRPARPGRPQGTRRTSLSLPGRGGADRAGGHAAADGAHTGTTAATARRVRGNVV